MNKLIAATVLSLLVGMPVWAEPDTAQLDPTRVSPEVYKVLLENKHVRVVEYLVPPGAKDNWHTHPAKVSYVVSGGALKITTENGESFVVNEEAGSATWFGEVGKHYGENVGTTPVRIVFVEIKGIDAEQDNLDRFKQ